MKRAGKAGRADDPRSSDLLSSGRRPAQSAGGVRALLGVSALLVVLGCSAQQSGRTGLLIDDVVVVGDPGAGPYAVYATLRSSVVDTLVGMRVDARPVSLHRVSMTGGMMRMEAVDHVVVEPPVTALEPGALHGMLEGSDTESFSADSVMVDAHLVLSGSIRVRAPVVSRAEFAAR